MDHLSYPSPIYNSRMVADPDVHRSMKETSSKSPTSVFAAAELNNVFRAPDSASNVVGDQEKENRPLAPSLICSFATDAELSTFSEDTEEGDRNETSSEGNNNNNNNNGMVRPRLAVRQRRSPLSIFRPSSGNKRRCDSTEREDAVENPGTPTKKRRPSAPLICHANPVGGSSSDDDDDENCHDDLPSMLSSSSSHSFASPFRRVFRGNSSSTISSYISTEGRSSFTSLFAASPATISNALLVDAAVDAVDTSTSTFSIMPRQLTQSLSFETLPTLKATNFANAEKEPDCKKN